MKKNLEQRIEEVIREEVSIALYDPQWLASFDDEAGYLRRRLTESLVTRIEHFGSTAVPGLAAKPIVDILMGVTDSEEVRGRIAPLLGAEGYEYFWRTDVSPPYAWFIKRDAEGRRTHHIHVVGEDSELWECLYFRDYLREFTDEARRYEQLKRSLCESHPNDRAAYTEGKAEYVRAVTEKARRYGSVAKIALESGKSQVTLP